MGALHGLSPPPVVGGPRRHLDGRQKTRLPPPPQPEDHAHVLGLPRRHCLYLGLLLPPDRHLCLRRTSPHRRPHGRRHPVLGQTGRARGHPPGIPHCPRLGLFLPRPQRVQVKHGRERREQPRPHIQVRNRLFRRLSQLLRRRLDGFLSTGAEREGYKTQSLSYMLHTPLGSSSALLATTFREALELRSLDETWTLESKFEPPSGGEATYFLRCRPWPLSTRPQSFGSPNSPLSA